MKYLKLLLPLIVIAVLFSGCSSHQELRKIKNRWNIPQKEDIKIVLINGDSFEFQKGEYKIFKGKQVLKGLGVKNNTKEISRVTIPLKDVKKVKILKSRIWNDFAAVGVVVGLGAVVYLLME